MLLKLLTSGAAIASLGVGMSRAKYVEFNHELARSYANQGITFLADIMEVDSKELMASTVDRIGCSTSDTSKVNDKVTVVLAISKCLNDSSIAMIDEWIAKIEDNDHLMYFKDGQSAPIAFETRVVPGACQARDERNAAGLHDTEFTKHFDNTWEQGGARLTAEEVTDDDVSRMATFAKYGHVLAGLPDLPATKETPSVAPIGVISFVTDSVSYSEVQQYERINQIDKAFNFQICHSGSNCAGNFENCVFLQETVDLFLYNPFTVTRAFKCDKLAGGVPISYIGADGNRHCYCSCPAGYWQKKGDDGSWSCEQHTNSLCDCEWQKRLHGYQHKVTTELATCSFDHIATSWGVDVPFPSDNYVADGRTNAEDTGNLKAGPRIKLSRYQSFDQIIKWSKLDAVLKAAGKTGVQPSDLLDGWAASVKKYALTAGDATATVDVIANPPSATTDALYPWKVYQSTRVSVIDGLGFTAYGKYHLEVNANDYSKDATCKGCVSIVDNNRPRHSTTCPVGFNDNVFSVAQGDTSYMSEMTGDNLDKANGLVGAFYDFGDKATNDACGSPRCDDQSFQIQDFFQAALVDGKYDDGRTCFNKDAVRSAFLSNPASVVNPLVDATGAAKQDDTPVTTHCTRCCSYATKLKEWWVDYTCGKDYDLEYCDGLDSESCSLKQCLTMDGNTLATAAARIRQSYVDESKAVIDALTEKVYQTHTQIHRALQCTAFEGTDGVCDFKAAISALLETSVSSNFPVTGYDIKKYVYWRYRVKGDDAGWRLVSDNFIHTFATPETKITLEAWSNCGVVRRFYFYVVLHTHSIVKVCDHFEDMWYQTSVSPAKVTTDLCAYPKSDFAELTFDYHPNVGLQYDGNQLIMQISAVQCKLTIHDDVGDRGTGVQIVNVVADSPEIIKRFAVELINKDITMAITRFRVDCTFTYKRYDKTTAPVIPCSKEFSIKDCTGPQIDIPEGECRYDDCAGKALPGPFEACGGTIVRSTATATTLSTDDSGCCQACHSTTTCNPILGLPNVADDIKRCEPTTGEPPLTDKLSHPIVINLMAEAMNNLGGHTLLLTVVSGSAVMAMVALVVVRRRQVNAAKIDVVDDAYYPLLH
ncbi:TPA: hypothetical protein N0F65_009772 [Lagenidium giganteum]|uniref:Uncharacterized protein n=1 Tax=Lagenidium giganteum TaxID=4803 RepID=A0AAV2YW82_9STRA|nr:TPA: hypothetical protein N0F65_009772 [Lagenidium giganteum]